MKEILLHICCGPCSIYPLKVLREEAVVTGYFYNPNIHPYTEWKARLETLEKYAGDIGLNMIYDRRYLLEDFIKGVLKQEGTRCSFCYETRLRSTAKTAKENGFQAFSTTLLVSPYQKHDLIRQIGESVAKDEGIEFVYKDFRPGYQEASRLSRELGMYRQKYCGCIFSEKERYYKPEEVVS